MEKNYEFLDELDLSLVEEPRKGKWVPIFKEFMKSDKKNCIVSFKNEDERKSCKASLMAMKRKHGIQIVYGNYGPGIRIYISKA